MKLKFKHQQYQANAAQAVVDLFQGQAKGFRKELVGRTGFINDEIFSNKKIAISEESLYENLKAVQQRNNIPISKRLQGLNFTIEMETGTGKTYVYTKTMYELNKQYGWNKFIIMVPSVAIREGVYKSLDITQEHFQEEYGKKIRFFIYDTGNKSNLVNIKSFAETASIEVIIMNYQAFASRSKDARKIYEELDGLQSQKPIDIIKRARPILIIDEPQKFGTVAEEKIKEFNSSFILRYSATHKEDYNPVYRLDAIDAFNGKLVKKINVKGIDVVGGSGTNSYLYIDRIQVYKDKSPSVWVEFEVKQQNGIHKKLRKLDIGDNLYELSNQMEQYKGFIVSSIDGRTDGVTFTNGVEIDVGEVTGDVNEDHLRRIQIRETIKSHIEKERQLFSKGIKVLSLFFIDEVAKYRQYDKQGLVSNGIYADIFEEEYQDIISQRELLDDEFNKYLNRHQSHQVHDGYFSKDNKKRYMNSTSGDSKEDIKTYDLIMKHKEKLLSFSVPTRFIFSHSALREGWDNPNIFQICTLKHSESTISRRQEIGRGLRICVNQNGDRMDYPSVNNEFFDYNTLTVIANESYEQFAKTLQKEITESLKDRPSELTADLFKDKTFINNETGEKFTFGNKEAMDLIIGLKSKGYLDDDYKVTEDLVKAVENKNLELPQTLKPVQSEIEQVIMRVYGTANFSATENEKTQDVRLQTLDPNENFNKKEFQELWNKLKVKTTYKVNFSTEELVQNSINAINSELNISEIKVSLTSGEQEDFIDREDADSGINLKKTQQQVITTAAVLGSIDYDLIKEVAEGARITRQSTVKILKGMHPTKFELFKINPEDFIGKVTRIITEQKATTLINSITYSKTDQVYDDEIFTINNFHGSLRENVLKVKRHIYDFIKTDSKIERSFAQDLETGQISVYAKLPRGFKIPTPVGNYNPDWALVIDSPDAKYVYFIAETKGTMSTLDLKKAEALKIDYARKHFEALNEAKVKYDVISTYADLINKVM